MIAISSSSASSTRFDDMLVFSPKMGGLDAVFDGADFARDYTPASILLASLLVHRRAHPDDTWPPVVLDWANPSSLSARGGWVGDALDVNGQLSGSRLWELDRRLADEQARSDCQDFVVEAVGPLEKQRGYALRVQTGYIAPQILGYSITEGSTTVQLSKVLG